MSSFHEKNEKPSEASQSQAPTVQSRRSFLHKGLLAGTALLAAAGAVGLEQLGTLPVAAAAVPALRGSPLVSFTVSGGSSRVYYYDSQFNIRELAATGSNWTASNITALAKAAPARTVGSPLTGFALPGSFHSRIYYFDSARSIMELAWNGSNWAPTTIASGIDIHKFSPLVSFAVSGGSSRVYCLDSQGDIIEVGWNGSDWVVSSITTITRTSHSLDGGPLTGFATSRGDSRLYYIDVQHRLLELAWTGSSWASTNIDFGATIRPGSPLVSFAVSGGSSRVYYFDTENNVIEVPWNGSKWAPRNNITALARSYPVTAASRLTGFALPGSFHSRLYCLNEQNHVKELAWNGSSWAPIDINQSYVGGDPAVGGSSLTGFALSGGDSRVYYLDEQGHVRELAWHGADFFFPTWVLTDVTLKAQAL